MTGEAQGPSSEPSHTSLEFEIATLAADGSGFSGDKTLLFFCELLFAKSDSQKEGPC